MASVAPNAGLPLLYKSLEPLSSQLHGDWRSRQLPSLDFLRTVHAIPLTVDEFVDAQRFYPIVFSVGPNPVPLALMSLTEGVNVFVAEDGTLVKDVYLPAYVRRFPYLLARLRPESEDLSLCFDATSGAVGAYEEGEALFDGDAAPSDYTKSVLAFCEEFENAGQRTAAFMKDLVDAKLLMEGEMSMQLPGAAQPSVFRGFQMVDETKLRDLRGDLARKHLQKGLISLAYAHIFSLGNMRELGARQQQMGQLPVADPQPAN